MKIKLFEEYIKESRFLSYISEFINEVKDIVDIEIEEGNAIYTDTVFDVRNNSDLYTCGRYKMVYGPSIEEYRKKYDIIDSLSINIKRKDIQEIYKKDVDILNLFRRIIDIYPNILIYKTDKLSDPSGGGSRDFLRIIIVNREVYENGKLDSDLKRK